MIQAGAASYLGLNLPQLLRANEARKGHDARADACIVIFLNGGPSHLDMWDPKPDAPAEVRGEFKPIPTSVPGVLFGEHLPKFARQMRRCTVIRSAHHSVNNAHAAAVYCALTGHDRGEIGGGARPDDYPCVGSVVGVRRPPAHAVPPHVLLPFITKEGAGGPPQPGFFGGWLGKTHDPLVILRDPNAADFALPELTLGPDINPSRFDARRDLEVRLAAARKGGTADDLDGIRAKAYDLLTAPAMREAVRLDREPAKLRDSYGRNIYGQSVLLARRLIEAGTRVACVSWAPDANATWDTHGNNFVKLKSELLPQLDAAFSTLLDDLDARGMLERTLVVVVGDFGRTPKINTNGAGRDHWNFCYSLVLAGGGVKGGYVHGASDKIGAKPSRNPVTPADVIATVYECLGVPPDLELQDRLGRPYVLCPWGRPIPEVLA
ncbi:DUF1501 domain-containing protein [Gemmata obscuriglobus]|uniref:DUF1501 domain-containing protein n=2 Tax=Gemmata obscuriglobus TaxID=114 RepID=A0A2Z3HLL5_9BACT|nr:DUF1501 domain-containing protein [Gemmata obscuriglobus]